MTNLTPLAQLAASVRLYPFGRGFFIAIGLAVTSFAVIPLVVRAALGTGAAASVAAVLAGCVVQAAGLWWFRGSLQLAALPGVSRLARKFSPRDGSGSAKSRAVTD